MVIHSTISLEVLFWNPQVDWHPLKPNRVAHWLCNVGPREKKTDMSMYEFPEDCPNTREARQLCLCGAMKFLLTISIHGGLNGSKDVQSWDRPKKVLLSGSVDETAAQATRRGGAGKTFASSSGTGRIIHSSETGINGVVLDCMWTYCPWHILAMYTDMTLQDSLKQLGRA